MAAQPIQTLKIFYCYAQEDDVLREQLARHLSPLRRLRYITGWYNRDIRAGTDWQQESQTQLHEANIILLLISSDFFASDYCYTVEMQRALARHRAGTACVIPILLRPVEWQNTPIGELAALPSDKLPVTQWADQDKAWLNVVQGLNEVIRNLLSQQQLSPEDNNILRTDPEHSIGARGGGGGGEGPLRLPILGDAEHSVGARGGEGGGEGPLRLPILGDAEHSVEARGGGGGGEGPLRLPVLGDDLEHGPLSGQTVGSKYLLGALIGEGGFSHVYKARHLLVDRQQAIKVLLEHHFRKRAFRDRFMREAQTVASLDHAHIIHLDDFWVETSQAYLVMPFIGGGTLQDIIDQQQGFLPTDRLVFYLEQICAALDYAHQHGVVHLDLKPLNLLVHQDDQLLLSDFGLAHLMKQGSIAGGSSLRIGTPHYMAPEHMQGRPERRSDLFSLGVILYQMLLGRLPFEGLPHEALIFKNITEWPPAPRTLRPDLPKSVEDMLAKALAKEPEQRYQTADEFLMAFKNALGSGRDVAKVPFSPNFAVTENNTFQTIAFPLGIKLSSKEGYLSPEKFALTPPLSRPITPSSQPAGLPIGNVGDSEHPGGQEQTWRSDKLPIAWVLVEMDGKVIGEYRLHKPIITIGRHQSCDIQIPNPYGVSRFHARIRASNDAWIIEDTESANGLFYLGKRVKKIILTNGDSITIAPDIRLCYQTAVSKR